MSSRQEAPIHSQGESEILICGFAGKFRKTLIIITVLLIIYVVSFVSTIIFSCRSPRYEPSWIALDLIVSNSTKRRLQLRQSSKSMLLLGCPRDSSRCTCCCRSYFRYCFVWPPGLHGDLWKALFQTTHSDNCHLLHCIRHCSHWSSSNSKYEAPM